MYQSYHVWGPIVPLKAINIGDKGTPTSSIGTLDQVANLASDSPGIEPDKSLKREGSGFELTTVTSKSSLLSTNFATYIFGSRASTFSWRLSI